MHDEPVFGAEFDAPHILDSLDPTAAECVRALVTEERFAVLCPTAQ
jgi:hypothetical protein